MQNCLWDPIRSRGRGADAWSYHSFGNASTPNSKRGSRAAPVSRSCPSPAVRHSSRRGGNEYPGTLRSTRRMGRNQPHLGIQSTGICAKQRHFPRCDQAPHCQNQAHDCDQNPEFGPYGQYPWKHQGFQQACNQTTAGTPEIVSPATFGSATCHAFPLYPTSTVDGVRSKHNEVISCLNSLYYGPAPPPRPPCPSNLLPTTAPPFQASRSIVHRLSTQPSRQGHQSPDLPLEVFHTHDLKQLFPHLPLPSATQRGDFSFIFSNRISLPDTPPPPNPSLGLSWIRRMPAHIQAALCPTGPTSFPSILRDTFVTGPDALLNQEQAPKPKLYASKSEYASFLDKAMSSGILSWTCVSNEHKDDRLIQDTITVTLFAVTKNADTDRLISWPRTQNDFLPTPPRTSLPDPSLFASLTAPTSNLSAFFLDIKDMFHNIVLPPHLSSLFPMPPIAFGNLAPNLQQRVAQCLAFTPQSTTLVRPRQATLPMGFTWSVAIAHALGQSCINESFAIFRSSRLSHTSDISLQFFLRENAPFVLTTDTPLALHTIDDISVVLINWQPRAVLFFYRILRNILSANNLPVKISKCSPFDEVELQSITFIGCVWHFHTGTVSASPSHVHKTMQDAMHLSQVQCIQTHCLERLVGRLVWLSMLNRPLLSILHNTFKATASSHEQPMIPVTPALRREILMATSLLPVCSANCDLPIAPIVVCFDASLTHGSVVATETTLETSTALWTSCAASTGSPGTMNQELAHFLKSNCWTHVRQQRWNKREDIFALEASTAVMALQWLIQVGLSNCRVVIATDSEPVKYAMKKGRSSCVPMLLRCRQAAALMTAYNLRILWTYVNTHHNPADKFTRP